MKKKYLTIRDIAELSGVSIATVSRVINTPELTSPDTRKKVMEIVDKYGYVPPQEVKNIFNGVSNTIAFFVYNMNNPFFSSIIKHLNRITFDNGYSLLICDTDENYEKELSYYEYCKRMRVAGIIYTAEGSRNGPPVDENIDIPIIIIGNSDSAEDNRYVIRSDYKKSMRLLVDYIYNLNHRKIGVITGALNTSSSLDRLNNLRANMDRYNLPCSDAYIYNGDYSVKSGITAFDYFYSMENKPTVVIAFNDQMAKGFILRANSIGVKIPEDISICGFDAIKEDFFYPSITSVQQNTELFAKQAFDFIANHEAAKAPREVILDVSIRAGDTCRKI